MLAPAGSRCPCPSPRVPGLPSQVSALCHHRRGSFCTEGQQWRLGRGQSRLSSFG